MTHGGAGIARGQYPGSNVGVVIQSRDDDFVAGPPGARQSAAEREGQRGHIRAEGYQIRVAGPEQIGGGFTRRRRAWFDHFPGWWRTGRHDWRCTRSGSAKSRQSRGNCGTWLPAGPSKKTAGRPPIYARQRREACFRQAATSRSAATLAGDVCVCAKLFLLPIRDEHAARAVRDRDLGRRGQQGQDCRRYARRLQKTSSSSSAIVTQSPKSGCDKSVIPNTAGSPICTGAPCIVG